MPNLLYYAAVFVNYFVNITASALPLLFDAIVGLLVAIAAVNFLFGLFGFKLGISEKFRENLRRKLKQNKKPFPFAIKARKRDTGKQADAKSPWTNPAEWSATNQDMLFAVEQLDADLDYMDTVMQKMVSTSMHVSLTDEGPIINAQKVSELSARFKRDFDTHAKSISDYWSQSFSHLGSLDGLAASNLDFETKRVLFLHAARLSKMKQQALAENQAEWAKQYGDGMPSQPVRFVA